MFAPLLTDGVVSLRPLRTDDGLPMYEAVCESLDDLKPWMSWAHDDYQKNETQTWIATAQERWKEGSYFGFAVLEAQTDLFLGGCSLSQIHPLYNFCNLGYWIRSSRRGRGFAGRASRLAARFALETLKLIRVEIVIAAKNKASQKVADKIGAHREGTLFNRIIIRDEIQDAIMYSLLPSDFGLTARL
jgi:ribosomal-protein-serine acetyltransferase